MHPTIIDLGPISLNGYGLMIGLGLLAAFQMVHSEARRTGNERLLECLEPLFLWAAAAVFIGGKLAYAVFYPEGFANLRAAGIGQMLGRGFVFYGSLALAIPTVLLFLRRHGLPVIATFDVAVLGAPLIHGFGRLGCFLAGCCHGCRTDGPFAVRFPPGPETAGIAGIPLHPVQVYEAVGLFGVFGVLLWLRKRRRFVGQIIASYLALYGVLRFLTEGFRGDGNPIVIGGDGRTAPVAPPDGLTLGQVTSLGIVAVGIGWLALGLRRVRRTS